MVVQKRNKRKNPSRLWVNTTVGVLCGVIVLVFLIVLFTQTGKEEIRQSSTAVATVEATTTEVATEAPTEEPSNAVVYPTVSADVLELTANNITSEYAILLDVEENTILAQRGADTRIYPASMTKIMTLLVAAENVDDLEDTFTMTYDIIAPLIEEDASRAGFEEGETVTIADLLYGIALPSGADATNAIAIYVSGSEEAFVELMNEKAEELGLENTHFVNTSGLHDENHYSTVTDIALLMEKVMENDICREILSTYQYTTSITEQHPEGILLESTMFSRMYGDEVEGITIEAGKTGYTDEAGHCLVSYATDETGKSYIAVLADDTTYWRAVFDTFALYGIIDGGYELPTNLTGEEETEETDTTDEVFYE